MKLSGRKIQRLLAILLFIVASGCDGGNGVDIGNPDLVPVPGVAFLTGQFLTANIDPILDKGLSLSGFYSPNFTADWALKAAQKASLISQSRVIYILATAYEITGDEKYREGMIRAADYLLAHFELHARTGVWVKEISPTGEVINSSFHAYGHAHVIFALAHAYNVSGVPAYRDSAYRTWITLNVPALLQNRNERFSLSGLNVAMHTFEALLVLYKATGSDLILTDLEGLGDYIVNHFYVPEKGYFVEGLGPNAKPALEGEIRLGHNIEMAFLLSRAVDIGLPATYLEHANKAVDFVAHIGLDATDNLIPHTVDYNGQTKDGKLYWWSQTEFLRGLAHFSYHGGRADLRSLYMRSFESVTRHFIDPVNGGWYPEAMQPLADKGHGWKVGYHVSMMISELLRLHRYEFTSGRETLL